jgi:nucleoside-diphosphate-sugar epimerase
VNTSRRRVLVTGCSGYIGSHTVKALKREGFDVHGIDWNRQSPNDVSKYVDKLMIGDVARLVVEQPSRLLECKRDLYDMCRSAYEMELKR